MLGVWLFLLLLPSGAVAADWWDDFSNNIATDLAPFLALLGEQVTKQYLSESTSYWDYFIFAMAPLGVLTALSSAIRVRGTPSARAFIGRAQEGAAAIELELLSSTSRNVGELYSNGGMTRVFGRPLVLELVKDKTAKWDDFLAEDKGLYEEGEPATAGVYTFAEYMELKCGSGQENVEWVETTDKPTPSFLRLQSRNAGGGNDEEQTSVDTDSASTRRHRYAVSPNLSLNAWMKKPKHHLVISATVLGAILQAGTIAVAIIVTYYLKFEKDGSAPPPYACPLMVAGTVLLSAGMFLCAFLVGEATTERKFRRRKANNPQTEFLWIQPGGQLIGDQSSEAFAHSECDRSSPLDEYITSWKADSTQPSTGTIWTAIGLTMVGFVLQFTGVRGLHSTVAVVQLGCMVVMSGVRALLRTQRLSIEHNMFDRVPELVRGHELDWATSRLLFDGSLISTTKAKADKGTDKKSGWDNCPPHWYFNGAIKDGITFLGEGFHNHYNTPTKIFHPSSRSTPSARIIGFRYNQGGDGIKRLLGEDYMSTSAKMISVRSRLSRHTNIRQDTPPPIYRPNSKPQPERSHGSRWSDERFAIRSLARRLSAALADAAGIIFADNPEIRLKSGWDQIDTFCWACHSSLSFGTSNQASEYIYLTGNKVDGNSRWSFDPAEIEAVLGLWVWALVSHPAARSSDDSDPNGKFEVLGERNITYLHIVGKDGTSFLGECLPNYRLYMVELQRTSAPPQSEPIPPESSIETESPTDFQLGGLWTLVEQKSMPRGCYSYVFQPTAQTRHTGSVDHFRLFGWQSVLATRGSEGPMKFNAVKVTEPLAVLCAQEVLASFVQAAMSLTTKFGMVEYDGYYGRFKIKLVDDLLELVPRHGLGSTLSAELCLRPIIANSPALKISGSSTLLLTDIMIKHFIEREEVGSTFSESISSERVMLGSIWETLVCEGERTNDGTKLTKHYRSSCRLISELQLFTHRHKLSTMLESESNGLFFDYRPEFEHYRGEYYEQLEASNLEDLTEHCHERIRKLGTDTQELLKLSPPEACKKVLEAINGDHVAEVLRLLDASSATSNTQQLDEIGILSLSASKKDDDDEQWSTVSDILLVAGCDPDHTDEKGRSPLSYAAEAGRLRTTHRLLTFGTPKGNISESTEPAPMASMINGYRHNVPLACCLEDVAGKTPIEYAAEQRHHEVLDLLLQCQISQRRVNIRDLSWDFILELVRMGDVETIKVVQNHFEICTITSGMDMSVFEATASAEVDRGTELDKDRKQVLNLLLQEPSLDLNQQYGRGTLTALMQVAKVGDMVVVERLLETGLVDCSMVNDDKRTAADIAFKYGHEEVGKRIQKAMQEDKGKGSST